MLKSQFKNLPRLKDWFCRSYNTLSILRLQAMIVLYISAQQFPLLQIVGMMAITGTFLVMTVRKQSRLGMFHSKVTYVFRLLEEITIMASLVAVFVYYLNGHYEFIPLQHAHVLDKVFLLTLVTGILVEMICAKYKGGKKLMKSFRRMKIWWQHRKD